MREQIKKADKHTYTDISGIMESESGKKTNSENDYIIILIIVITLMRMIEGDVS